MSEHSWIPTGGYTTSHTCTKCGDMTDAGEPPRSSVCSEDAYYIYTPRLRWFERKENCPFCKCWRGHFEGCLYYHSEETTETLHSYGSVI